MKYSSEDLVRIAKRENNTMRGYLVVDPMQAKHVPVSPTKALELFTALADTFRGEYAGEKLLLVGFAETATAIGAQVARSLGTMYIQTTREIIDGVDYLFFSEEHSHATEQKLVKNDIDEAMKVIDRIIFVEDEVTTGKTILNIIDVINRTYDKRIKYSVASLLNGMQKEHLDKYAARGVKLHYLVKTDHSTYEAKAQQFAGDGIYHGLDDILGNASENIVAGKNAGDNLSSENIYSCINISGAVNARRLIDSCEYEAACKKLFAQIESKVISNCNCLGNDTTKASEEKKASILVIGTEETMFPAIYVGSRLEQLGFEVKTHSTTRSPIAVSTEAGYPLGERFELRSLYDDERRTFIYNIEKYDSVIVVTDAGVSGGYGEQTLIDALMTHNNRITLVRWC